jgi:hypothetical protein
MEEPAFVAEEAMAQRDFAPIQMPAPEPRGCEY